MSNVISFAAAKKKKEVVIPVETTQGLPQAVQDLVYDIYQWAHDNGVDTESYNWKWEMATITTVLQGMLHKSA